MFPCSETEYLKGERAPTTSNTEITNYTAKFPDISDENCQRFENPH